MEDCGAAFAMGCIGGGIFSFWKGYRNSPVVRQDTHTHTHTHTHSLSVLGDTVEPLNNGHIGDECFVHCSEVVPSSAVEMYGKYTGGEQFVLCREVIQSEVSLYCIIAGNPLYP